MNSDELENARRRKARSRAHARGKHDLCRPERCDQAPGAGEVTRSQTEVTSPPTVTIASHGGEHATQDVTIDGENITATQRAKARETKALELMAGGWSKTAIAEELGYADHSGVSRAVSRALARQATIHGDELRKMNDAELVGLRDKLHLLLNMPGVSADTAIKCVSEIRKLLESRSKLAGLDAGAVGQQPGESSRNDWTQHRGYHLAIDGSVVRELLPYPHMVLDAHAGAGCVAGPTVVLNPAVVGQGHAIRVILKDGGLMLDGLFFRVDPEHVSDELIEAWMDAGTGPPAA